MTKATKRLSNFDFSGGNAAMALVSKDVGGPATGIKTLQMKNADVVLALTMEDFLVKFFGMWYDDAEFLAKLLGYEIEDESWLEYHTLYDKVALLKSLKGSEDLTKSIAELSVTQQADLQMITKSLAKSTNYVIKADMTKEMGLLEFLGKFLELLGEDADFLNKLLGGDSEDTKEPDSEMLEESHTEDATPPYVEGLITYNPTDIMTILNTSSDLPTTIKSMDSDQQQDLQTFAKSLADRLGYTLKDSEGVINKSSDDATPTPKEETKMSDTAAAIQKALDDQNAKHQAELEKANKTLANVEKALGEMKAKEEALVVAEYTEKAQGYKELVEGFDAEAMGVALRKATEDATLSPLLGALAGALKVTKNADALKEEGHDLDVEEPSAMSGTLDVLKSRKKSA